MDDILFIIIVNTFMTYLGFYFAFKELDNIKSRLPEKPSKDPEVQ